MSIRSIFISHASIDKDLVSALVRLLQSALRLSSEQITATSVNGYGLTIGDSVSSVLRKKAINDDVLIALITPASLRSSYVSFEIGARWGSGKHLLPLRAGGVRSRDIAAPLNEVHLATAEIKSDLQGLLEKLSQILEVSLSPSDNYDSPLAELTALAKRKPLPTTEIRKFCHRLAEKIEDFNLVPYFEGISETVIAILDTSEDWSGGTGAYVTSSGLIWRNRDSPAQQSLSWHEMQSLRVKGFDDDDQVRIGSDHILDLSHSDMEATKFAKLLRNILTLQT